MKKLLAMLCIVTCFFGLTACGEKELSAAEEQRVESAKLLATQYVLPYLQNFFDDEIADEYLEEYDREEMEYIAESVFSNVLSMYAEYGYDTGIAKIYVDGSGFLGGISSFNSAHEKVGDVAETGDAQAEVSGDEIIVTVPVTGSLKNATAEIIFSNDIFLTVKACALNPESSMREAMSQAGLNTLLGMGTVFAVLILISLIISAFGFIPKLQARAGRKNKKEELDAIKSDAVDNTIARIIEKEEQSDDAELVAVIAAAVAAYEERGSAEGFVVRSVRKVRR